MAVTQVTTRLGYDHEFSLGQLAPLRTFSRYYWVYCDTKDESPENVRIASGLPQIGDFLSTRGHRSLASGFVVMRNGPTDGKLKSSTVRIIHGKRKTSPKTSKT
jgi:hypothetical protein